MEGCPGEFCTGGDGGGDPFVPVEEMFLGDGGVAETSVHFGSDDFSEYQAQLEEGEASEGDAGDEVHDGGIEFCYLGVPSTVEVKVGSEVSDRRRGGCEG